MASGVAAAGAAVAFYFYSKKLPLCGFNGSSQSGASASDQHFENTYQAPSTWIEALYFFAEALRYMYHESLGTWRSSDLLIGLAYLAQQEAASHAARDIAQTGKPVGQGLPKEERAELARHFKSLAHFMKFCQALRERHMPTQSLVLSKLGIQEEDILMQQGFAGMLKPSYVIVRDHKAKCIVLAIRGTHSIKDMFTSLTSATKPHHMVVSQKVILGYSHFGMLAAARWVLQQTEAVLRAALQDWPSYRLQVVGHSLGGGTAALLTARLREMGDAFGQATCLAIACPACMTKELAASCASYTTTIINSHDMIPTLSPGAADALREEVMQSSWYETFRADLRSSIVVRAVEASVEGVGSVSSWTSARLSSASKTFRSCYAQRPAILDYQPVTGGDTLQNGKHADMQSITLGIQNARDWIDPEVEQSQVSWSQVLRTLEPLERNSRGSSIDEKRSGEQNDASFSGRPHIDVRASWPPVAAQSVASSSQTAASASIGIPKPSLWGRLWPNCTGSRPPSGPAAKLKIDEATQDSNFDSLQPPDTPSMRMARTKSEGLWEECEAFSPSGAQSSSASIWGSPPEKALSDSETDDGGQISKSRQQRRLTYPAGKIYHLLPAHLVFGPEEAKKRLDRRKCSLSSERDTALSVPGESENAEAATAAGNAESGQPSVEGQFQDVFREGVDGAATPSPGADPFVVITTNRMKGKLGVAPPIPPMQDVVLLEQIPQELYGRIRLCKRMLADHFIPVYLGALEIAVDYLEHDYYCDPAKDGDNDQPSNTLVL